MKRNKRTQRVSHENLSPLTERILNRMGTEGDRIRRRLQLFYQYRRDTEKEPDWEPPLEN